MSGPWARWLKLQGKTISLIFFVAIVFYLVWSHHRHSPLFTVHGNSITLGCEPLYCASLRVKRGLSYQLCKSLSGTLAAICFFTPQLLYPATAVFLWVILPIPPQESRPPLLLPILSFPPCPWSWTALFLRHYRSTLITKKAFKCLFYE